jgi:hypothetical protein
MADEICRDEAENVSAIQVALLVIISAILIFYVARFLGLLNAGREKFVSKQAKEVHDRAREVFQESGGDARYSDYKKKVPGADPVQYKDVRGLYKAGAMTPESVQSVI